MRRSRDSREQWEKRVERWRDSGLTAKEFAAEIGVNERTLSYWKWRIGSEAQPSKASRKTRGKGAELAPLFVEMTKPEAAPAIATSTQLEVVVSEGAVVRVPVGFDTETLGRLLAVLKAQ